MASFNGHTGCVRELLSSGAVVDLADEVSICIGSMLIRGPSHHYFGNCMRTNQRRNARVNRVTFNEGLNILVLGS